MPPDPDPDHDQDKSVITYLVVLRNTLGSLGGGGTAPLVPAPAPAPAPAAPAAASVVAAPRDPVTLATKLQPGPPSQPGATRRVTSTRYKPAPPTIPKPAPPTSSTALLEEGGSMHSSATPPTHPSVAPAGSGGPGGTAAPRPRTAGDSNGMKARMAMFEHP